MSVLRELERVPLGLPDGLEIEWLGVAGYRLTYEGVSIFVDPYVSRVPLTRCCCGGRRCRTTALIERYVRAPGPVAGVLIGHTHWDHAVDAPAIARRFGCPAYGSDSLARLMRLHGLDGGRGRAGPAATSSGRSSVRFVPSRHSKLLFGRKIPFDGPLTCDDLHALRPGAYKCGAVYGIRIDVAGTSFYHQGSADLDDAALGDEPVDVFLAGVTGRQVTPHYWERILPKLDPRVLVPTHYDDFFAPLGRSLKLFRGVNLDEVPDEVRSVSRDLTVAALSRSDSG